ncbi:unnamed protein product [Euphydryas editha]|nr:unnamed protein product [Euphydryas editha]
MKINQTKKWIEMMSDKNFFGENYPRPECEASPLTHLERTESRCMDQPMSSPLTERNYNGEQCSHMIAKCKDFNAREMMRRVLELGADINGQESLNGSTPLHLCVEERNYELAEWLCERPDVNLEATNYAGQTAYQLALKRNDSLLKKMLIDTGCKVPPSYSYFKNKK